LTIFNFSSKVASFIEGDPDNDSPRFGDHFLELVVCEIERYGADPVKLMSITNHSVWNEFPGLFQVIALQTDKWLNFRIILSGYELKLIYAGILVCASESIVNAASG